MGLDLYLGKPTGGVEIKVRAEWFAEGLQELIDAIDNASDQDKTTWIISDGKRIAAIVPVDVAEELTETWEYDKDAHAQWSYGGFGRFREHLAAGIGLVLGDMMGYSGERPGIEWSTVDSDLVPLLHHSDCDGEMTPQECARVAPVLRAAVEAWPDDDYDKQQAGNLASMMERAGREGLTLCFR